MFCGAIHPEVERKCGLEKNHDGKHRFNLVSTATGELRLDEPPAPKPSNYHAQVAAKLLDGVLSARPSMNPCPGSELNADEYLSHVLDARARMIDEIAVALEADPAAVPALLRRHATMLRAVAKGLEAP